MPGSGSIKGVPEGVVSQPTVPWVMSDDDDDLDEMPGPSGYFRPVALTAEAESGSESEENEAGPSWVMDVDSGGEAGRRLVPIEEGDVSMFTPSDSDEDETEIDLRMLDPRFRRYDSRVTKLYGKRR